MLNTDAESTKSLAASANSLNHAGTPMGSTSMVRAPKRTAVVADTIIRTILEQGLQPGAVLPTESRMMEQYGVSRGTVREALRLLEGEGLIYLRPGPSGGPVVQRPPRDRLPRLLSLLLSLDGTSLREVLEARQILEPALARHAAQHASDADIGRLLATHKELGETLAQPRRFLELNNQFHSLIALMSGNRVLAGYWAAISEISDGQEMWVRYTAQALKATFRAHEKLCRAIQRRDSAEAERAMHNHMIAHAKYLLEQDAGSLDQPVKSIGLASHDSIRY